MKERLVPSIHCVRDRADRIAFIATTIGFGEIIQKRVFYTKDGRSSIRCLTSTGVIICKDMSETKVITMFIAREYQVVSMYCGGHVPSYIFAKVRKNKKYLKMQDNA